MKKSIHALKEYLDQRGKQYKLDPAQNTAYWRMWGQKACYPSQMTALDNEGGLELTLRFAFLVPQDKRSLIDEVALPLIPFQTHAFLYKDQGEIRIQSTLESEQALDPENVRSFVHAVMHIADALFEPILKICHLPEEIP